VSQADAHSGLFSAQRVLQGGKKKKKEKKKRVRYATYAREERTTEEEISLQRQNF